MLATQIAMVEVVIVRIKYLKQEFRGFNEARPQVPGAVERTSSSRLHLT